VVFLFLWGKGLLHPGVMVPDEYAEYLFVDPSLALREFGNALHVDLPAQPWMLLVWLVSIGAVAGAALVSAGRLVSLDPEGVGFRSFWWAIKSITKGPAVLFCLGAVTLVSVVAIDEDSVLIFAVLPLSILVSSIAIPISVCHPAAVGRDRALRWWAPRWPGGRAVTAFLGIELLGFAFHCWEAGSPRGTMAFLLASAASFVFPYVAPLCQGKLLIAAASSREWNLRSAFRWAVVGPWIALHLWMLSVLLVCAGPFIVAYVWLWKIVPVLASMLSGLDGSLPYSYQLTVNTLYAIGRFSWLYLMVPLSLFSWFATAKFVVDTNQEERKVLQSVQ